MATFRKTLIVAALASAFAAPIAQAAPVLGDGNPATPETPPQDTTETPEATQPQAH